jgi:hypothetical protein
MLQRGINISIWREKAETNLGSAGLTARAT